MVQRDLNSNRTNGNDVKGTPVSKVTVVLQGHPWEHIISQGCYVTSPRLQLEEGVNRLLLCSFIILFSTPSVQFNSVSFSYFLPKTFWNCI